MRSQRGYDQPMAESELEPSPLAEALFAPVAAWLTAVSPCSVPQLARGLRRAARALLRAGHGP